MRWILAIVCFLFVFRAQHSVIAQSGAQIDKYVGTWDFEINDTPYGDYKGYLYLFKSEDETINGKIKMSHENEMPIQIEKFKENRLVFSAVIDGANSLWSGYFNDMEYTAVGEVQGDDFTYALNGTKRNDE